MFQIIAEEPDFLVVCKPAGVHFHSQDGHPGLFASLERARKEQLYAVHRLDTVTSGLLLIARSAKAARTLGGLFAAHMVQKYYVALALGKPKKKQGRIIGDMAKSRRSQYKLLRSRNAPAVTQFFSSTVIPGMRLYLLRPLSGKTHQLRVAMSSLGTPILGDTLYGGKAADRSYLHAWRIEFCHHGREYAFTFDPDQGELFMLPEAIAQLAQYFPPSSLPWPGKKT